MEHQPPLDHIHYREQSQQLREPYRPRSRHAPYGQSPGNLAQQRREFLWRERISREMHRQELMARAASLEEEWVALQQRKASIQHQKPKLAVLVVLSRLVGIRSLPVERRFWNERERLAQDEARLQQARSSCKHHLTALHVQIEVIEHELSSLSAHTSPL